MDLHVTAIARFAGAALIAASLAYAPHAARATIVTLDLSLLGTGAFTTAQYLEGFVLTPNLGPSSIPQIVNSGGYYNLQSTSSIGAGGADTLLTRADGGTFTLLSVQAAVLGGDSGTYGIAIVNPSNGPAGFFLGQYLTGTPAPSTFTFYDLSGNASLANTTAINLDPVSENGNNFAIAEITVSYEAIPEPATAAVLGLGVAGLLARRRKN